MKEGCSMGYRAKYNGIVGFVTAAPCIDDGEIIKGYGEAKFGVADLRGIIAAAFIESTAGNSITNNLQWGTHPTTKLSTSTNLYQALVVGALVAKSGGTTYATSGRITSINFSSTDNKTGMYEAKFIRATAKVNHGDSKGVVYKLSSTSAQGGIVLGIIHFKVCTNDECNDSGDVTFSRVDWIDKELGLTRY